MSFPLGSSISSSLDEACSTSFQCSTLLTMPKVASFYLEECVRPDLVLPPLQTWVLGHGGEDNVGPEREVQVNEV